MLKKMNETERLWLVNEKKDDGFAPLHLACLNNHLDVARELLDCSATQVDIENLSKQTPLHLCVERQHFELIKLLIEKKCNLNAQDKDGDTPLHCILRQVTLSYLKRLQDIQENVSLIFFF